MATTAKEVAGAATATSAAAAREQFRLELWQVFRDILIGKDKWVDEVARTHYENQFKEQFSEKYDLLLKMLHPDNLSTTDQHCLDMVALEHAKLADKSLHEKDTAKLIPGMFKIFCDKLEEVIDLATEGDEFDVIKAHTLLRDKRWIGQGFWAQRLKENMGEILKLGWISEGLRRFIQSPIVHDFMEGAEQPSIDFFEWAQQHYNLAAKIRSGAPSNRRYSNNPFKNFFVGLQLMIGVAWNYLMVGLGKVNKLRQQNWHRIGKRTFWTTIIVLGVVIAFLILLGLGIHNSYFKSTNYLWLIATAGILLFIIFATLKIIEAALGLAIFTVRLAFAVIARPSLWTVEQGGKFIWQVGTWPIEFGFDAITDTFKGLLMFLGVDIEDIERLSDRKFELTEAQKSAWGDLSKRTEDLMKGARQTSIFITVGFKYFAALITSTSFLILAKWQFSGVDSSAVLNNPVFALLILFLLGSLFTHFGIREYQARIAKATGLDDKKRSWRTVNRIAFACLVLLILAEWRFETVTNVWYYNARQSAAITEHANQERRLKTAIWEKNRSATIHRGATVFLAETDTENDDESYIVITDSTFSRPNPNVVYVVKPALEQNGQVFTIYNPIDQNGIRQASLQYAVLAQYLDQVTPNEAARLLATKTEAKPSLMPSSITYNPSKGMAVLGYVNTDDVLYLDPVQLSLLSCPEESDIGLKGTHGTPRSRHEDWPEEFVDQRMRLGALLVKLPAYGWQPLYQAESFNIRGSGTAMVCVNTRRGLFGLNEGGMVDIAIRLETYAEMAQR